MRMSCVACAISATSQRSCRFGWTIRSSSPSQDSSQSDHGTARQARISPSAFSFSDSANSEYGDISTSPACRRDLQAPQLPERQPCGYATPDFSADSRMVWPISTLTGASAWRTRTVKPLMALPSMRIMFRSQLLISQQYATARHRRGRHGAHRVAMPPNADGRAIIPAIHAERRHPRRRRPGIDLWPTAGCRTASCCRRAGSASPAGCIGSTR